MFFMPVYAEMLTIRKIVFWKYVTSLVHNVVGSEDGKCWLWLSNVKKCSFSFVEYTAENRCSWSFQGDVPGL